MKSLFILCIFSILLTSSSFSQQNGRPSDSEGQWAISMEQRIHGLMTIWSEVKFGFPYPEKLKTLDWDNKVQEYIPRVTKADNEDDYYKALMEFAVLLQDDHTKVLPPWGYFKPGYDYPPIQIQVIDRKFYISRLWENEDIVSQQLAPGTEILEVNNVSTQTFFQDQILKYYTQGTKQANEAILVFYLLHGPKNEKVQLKIKNPGATEKNVKLARNSKDKDGAQFLYTFAYNAFVASTIEVKWFRDNILYINIPSFENDQIANDFQTLIDTVDISRIKGMILDVRNNMGGSDRNSAKVVECLINKPVSSPSMHFYHYIAAYKAWGKNDKIWDLSQKTIMPRDGKKYLGPIALLTGPVSTSSAEDLIIELKETNRTTTIGQRTAGGAGNTLIFNLPGGGTFRMATFKATFPDETEYIGIGIKPDIELYPTVDDLVNNYDRVLEKGIELFRQ